LNAHKSTRAVSRSNPARGGQQAGSPPCRRWGGGNRGCKTLLARPAVEIGFRHGDSVCESLAANSHCRTPLSPCTSGDDVQLQEVPRLLLLLSADCAQQTRCGALG